MVNKQYNVQNLSKNKTKNSNHIDTEALKQTITVIPNESILNGSIDANDTYQSQNAFERNITQQFYHSLTDSLDFVDGNHNNHRMTGDDSMADIVKNSGTGATDNDTQSQKHLSINDIGRFQYILQMDREMVRFSLFFLHYIFIFCFHFQLIQKSS